MACEIKLGCAAVVLMLVSYWQQSVVGVPQVPCYFIFGDSLADSGNNNALVSMIKANYLPYGIDFPSGATGRFTNGATAFDIIAKLLGFDNYIPPFAKAVASDILEGVNYASGGSGIRDETSQQLGERISFNKQLANHQETVTRIITKLGGVDSATQYLNKCLYTVGFGYNDYINNYFLPQYYPTSRLYTPEQYAQVLVNQYSIQLRILHKNGARKIALFGLGQFGCTPYAIKTFPVNRSGCVDKINDAVQLFNNKLKPLVDQLNSNLNNAKFIFVNVSGMSADLASAGFTVLNASCCQVTNNGECIRNSTPCQNRNQYLFWDLFHPTQASNQITGPRAYNATAPSDAYPYDISHLVRS